jgi:hypothetical protein
LVNHEELEGCITLQLVLYSFPTFVHFSPGNVGGMRVFWPWVLHVASETRALVVCPGVVPAVVVVCPGVVPAAVVSGAEVVPMFTQFAYCEDVCYCFGRVQYIWDSFFV